MNSNERAQFNGGLVILALLLFAATIFIGKQQAFHAVPTAVCRICACEHLVGKCVETCRAHVCPVDCENKCHHNGFCPAQPKKANPITDGLEEEIR